jgi:hypothetical protein
MKKGQKTRLFTLFAHPQVDSGINIHFFSISPGEKKEWEIFCLISYAFAMDFNTSVIVNCNRYRHYISDNF